MHTKIYHNFDFSFINMFSPSYGAKCNVIFYVIIRSVNIFWINREPVAGPIRLWHVICVGKFIGK